MSARLLGVGLGLLGLLLIAALLFRRDPIAELEHASRRRRRLLAAGLALLAATGIHPELLFRGGPALRLAQAESKLATQTEWMALEAAWKEAEAVASGSRGQYPFNEAGQKRLLDSLAKARGGLDGLVKDGLLAQPAAELLKKDLEILESKVREFRPTEMKRATCYEPMAMRSLERESFERLRKRLPLIERLKASEQLPRRVLDKLVVGIERDLDRLGEGNLGKSLSLTEQKEVASIQKRVRAKLAALKAKVK